MYENRIKILFVCRKTDSEDNYLHKLAEAYYLVTQAKNELSLKGNII